MPSTSISVQGQVSLHGRLLRNPGSLALPSGEDAADDGDDDDVAVPLAVSRSEADGDAPKARCVKKLRKRTQEYQDSRDASRRAAWKARKAAEGLVVHGGLRNFVDLKVIGGFIGPKGAAPVPITPYIVAYNGGSAASVLDLEGRLMAHRGYEGSMTRAANTAAIAAAAYLAENGHIKPTTENKSRGDFKKYYFILHRESLKHPRMHSYFNRNKDAGLKVAELLQPLLRIVNAVFEEQFPALYQHYKEVLRFTLDRNGDLIAPMFPFASFALNVGDVVAQPHRDCLNFGPGLCCIVPFETFDPSQDARIGLAEAGVEVESGPGMPTFIPSAIVTHYNTPLVTESTRGSVVLWTNGSIFQYHALGGRPVNCLSSEEKLAYSAALQARIMEGISRFPIIPPIKSNSGPSMTPF